MFTFLGAGLESSTGQFLLAARALALHPEARARLIDDPSLIPTGYEELVRFDCGPNRFHRTLTRDIELHGEQMRAGDSVLVMYGSANRDDRRFERAESSWSTATRTLTSVSDDGRTSASARPSPACKPKCSSRRSWPRPPSTGCTKTSSTGR